MQVVFMKETPNMKKLNLSLAILALAAISVNAQTVNSDPVGYVNVKITAGTGTAKKLSYISAPKIKYIYLNCQKKTHSS